MTIALAVLLIAVTTITGLVMIVLFVWGAVKDGEDNDAIQRRRVIRRRWPRDTS